MPSAILYEGGGVTVRRGIVEVKGAAYSTNYVTSVKPDVKKPSAGREIWISLFALLLLCRFLQGLLQGKDPNYALAIIALCLFFYAVIHSLGKTTSYAVIMKTTNEGEIRIPASDPETMRRIWDAVSQSIEAWDTLDRSRYHPEGPIS